MTTLSFYVYNDSMSSGACVVIHFFLLPEMLMRNVRGCQTGTSAFAQSKLLAA